MSDDERWRATIEQRLDRHGQTLETLKRDVASLHQVLLGPQAMNGLRQEVRDNEAAIRKIREEELRNIRDQEIAPLRSARDEADAVRETRKSLIRIGATVVVAQVAIITLLLRIAEVL